MKYRTGFVSNSSSSSFCILGYRFDIDELFDKLKIDNLKEKLYDMLDDEYFVKYAERKDLPLDTAENILNALKKYEDFDFLDLDYEIDGECNIIYIGSPWYSIKDDETGKEFKTRVHKTISKVLKVETEPITHMEVIYN